MKFYKVYWRDAYEPTAQQADWATTRREAEKIAREQHGAEIAEVDVPTDKAGLLDFLKWEIWR